MPFGAFKWMFFYLFAEKSADNHLMENQFVWMNFLHSAAVAALIAFFSFDSVALFVKRKGLAYFKCFFLSYNPLFHIGVHFSFYRIAA